MGKLKIGFIGCGGIANDKHFPGMATQRDRIDMYAFCDIIPERAEEARAKYGCEGAKVFTDYRELLKDPDIYAVHVLTPNVKHCEISVAAMEAGKHVICEKPMAATYADALKMYETHLRTGKLLTIGYQYRHMDNNKAMKSYVDTGALGEILLRRGHRMAPPRHPHLGCVHQQSRAGRRSLDRHGYPCSGPHPVDDEQLRSGQRYRLHLR